VSGHDVLCKGKVNCGALGEIRVELVQLMIDALLIHSVKTVILKDVLEVVD
jgi:hypothetical protein